MAQETKVGLLIGLALILLVGLVLSDLFTGGAPEAQDANRAATEFGREAQASIYEAPTHAPAPSAVRRDAFDAAPGFSAEPALDYGRPSPLNQGLAPTPTPHESWSPPTTPTEAPSQPALPELTVEPPLPELDTLEAMRLAVQNPVEVKRDLDALPTRIEPAATEAATIAPTPSVPDALASGSGGTTYIHYVQAGQTLSEIARQHYGNPEFAAAIAQTNPTKVDREGQVRPGARLEIPPLGSPVFSRLFMPVHDPLAMRVDPPIPALPNRPAGPTAAVPAEQVFQEIQVQPGDTLSELASEHLGTSKRWQELIDANSDQLTSAADLRSGMTLRLPAAADDVPVQTLSVTDKPAAATATRAVGAPAPAADKPDTYTVQSGDNLTRIAARLLGDGERWDELLAANADQLDRPENLRSGMTLKLPTASASPDAAIATNAALPGVEASPVNGKTYTVQAGDNLTRIAARTLGNGNRWQELFDANADQLDSPNDLFAGQTLRLP